MQLTFIGGEYTGLPTWSPDGKHLALYSRVKDRSQIFLIGADGTGLRQVTSGDFNHFFPGWSRDGHWIYFSANSAETVQVWKIPAEGGSPVQVTRQGGFASRESSDGKFLYYTKTESTDTSLWRKRLPDGEESQIVASVHLHNFDVAADGVYFLDSTSSLKFITTNEKILTMATGVPQGYVGFSVAPDRRSLLFCVSKPQSSEIALINNFQ